MLCRSIGADRVRVLCLFQIATFTNSHGWWANILRVVRCRIENENKSHNPQQQFIKLSVHFEMKRHQSLWIASINPSCTLNISSILHLHATLCMQQMLFVRIRHRSGFFSYFFCWWAGELVIGFCYCCIHDKQLEIAGREGIWMNACATTHASSIHMCVRSYDVVCHERDDESTFSSWLEIITHILTHT